MKWKIDEITKFLGAAAIAAYLIGYLVFSFYLARYGFIPSSPLRPRVLQAGIATLCIFILPFLIGFGSAHVPSRGLPLFQILVIRIGYVSLLCYLTAQAIAALAGTDVLVFKALFDPVSIRLPRLLQIAIVTASAFNCLGAGVAITWGFTNFHKHKRAALSIFVLLIISESFLMTITPSTSLGRNLYVFLFAMSAIVCVGLENRRDEYVPTKLRELLEPAESNLQRLNLLIKALDPDSETHDLDLHSNEERLAQAMTLKAEISEQIANLTSDKSPLRMLSLFEFLSPVVLLCFALALVFLYVNLIFPILPYKLGGGKPAAILLFRKEGGSQPKVVPVNLLDQDDQGFYVLLDGHDKAIFLPKEFVSGIVYSREDGSAGNQIIQ